METGRQWNNIFEVAERRKNQIGKFLITEIFLYQEKHPTAYLQPKKC